MLIHFSIEERHCRSLCLLSRQLEQGFCQRVPYYCCSQRFVGHLSAAPGRSECECVVYPSVHLTIGPSI